MSDDYVGVKITSNLTTFESEKRFPSNINLASLKGKLELLTGGSMNSMKVELRDKDNKLIKVLVENDKSLKDFGVENGMKIHVIDTPSQTQEEDTSNVAFQLSPEEYEQREESARNFLLKNKLGKYNEENIKKKAEEEQNEIKLSESITVGSRCEVTVVGQLSRRGVVKYVGKVHFKEGIWVGVQYDEPLGKNDGSVEGKRYFECKPKYGGFVRPSMVKTGDYPEIEEFDEI